MTNGGRYAPMPVIVRPLRRCSQKKLGGDRPAAIRSRAPATTATRRYSVASTIYHSSFVIRHFASRLNPAAQDFSDAPGLSNTTAGVVRFAGVEHFADGADAVVA